MSDNVWWADPTEPRRRWAPRWWIRWRNRRALRSWTDLGYVEYDGFGDDDD